MVVRAAINRANAWRGAYWRQDRWTIQLAPRLFLNSPDNQQSFHQQRSGARTVSCKAHFNLSNEVDPACSSAIGDRFLRPHVISTLIEVQTRSLPLPSSMISCQAIRASIDALFNADAYRPWSPACIALLRYPETARSVPNRQTLWKPLYIPHPGPVWVTAVSPWPGHDWSWHAPTLWHTSQWW